MKTSFYLSWLCRAALALFGMLFAGFSEAVAGGKIGVYGIHMAPRGDDAKNFSRPGYGLGGHIVVPVPQLLNFFAGTAGFEGINLLSETVTFRDRLTGLRVEQQTSQDYFRLFLGGQIGGHGKGFFRPHAGLNLATVFYGINTDVVIPDDEDREKEVRQKLRGENHTVFGYDITLGVDLNFWNKWNLDGGVRYLKSFSLPQQLGAGSGKIHPEYFQVYLGIGLSFRAFRQAREKEE